MRHLQGVPLATPRSEAGTELEAPSVSAYGFDDDFVSVEEARCEQIPHACAIRRLVLLVEPCCGFG